MKKKIICAALALSAAFTAAGGAQFDWAKTAVDFCTKRGILSGMENGDLNLAGTLTREQMAKLLCDAFGLDVSFRREPTFNDIDEMRWSYGYIGAVSDYLFAGEKRDSINPSEEVTREEFCATLAMAFGLTNASLRNPTLLDSNFSDAAKVSKSYKRLVGAAVERGLMSGADGALNPGGKLNRAEACSFLYRAVSVKEGKLTITPSDLGVIQSSTPMLGAPEATLEGAKAWAAKNGATDSFVDAAELYWKYGEITGIRPDILYAQAAKETGYGKYGGAAAFLTGGVSRKMHLHARRIRIDHPDGGKIDVTAELPQHFAESIDLLGFDMALGNALAEDTPPPPSRAVEKAKAKAHAKTVRKERRGERRSRGRG